MNILYRTFLLIAHIHTVAADIQFITPQAKTIVPGSTQLKVTFGERGESPRLTELSTYVINLYSGLSGNPVLASSNVTATGTYDPNVGLQTAILNLSGIVTPDIYFLGIKSTLRSNATIIVTNFSFRFAISGQDGCPNGINEILEENILPQRHISCDGSPCDHLFSQAKMSTTLDVAARIKGLSQFSESTNTKQPTHAIDPRQTSMLTRPRIHTRIVEPILIRQANLPSSNTCITQTITVTAVPVSPSRISGTGGCASVIITTMNSIPKPSICSLAGPCTSSISAVPLPPAALSKGSGNATRIGVIVFVSVLLLVIVGSVITAIRLRKNGLLESTDKRASSGWWNLTPIRGSLTSLIVQPLNINKEGRKKRQQSTEELGNIDPEGQRPISAYSMMKEDTGEIQRWRDSLSTIEESDTGGSEKGLTLQRTLSEKRVGMFFDEKTRSKYYGTGDI